MSKNIVKSYYTTKETSTPRIIDGNVAVEQVMERINLLYPDGIPNGFQSGIAAETVQEYAFDEEEYSDGINAEMLEGLVGDSDAEFDDESISSNVIKANSVDNSVAEEVLQAELADLRQRMLEEAQADIAIMKNQAAEEIAREKTIAFEEAKRKGYREGIEKAYAEMDEERRQIIEEHELQTKEYEDLIFELEPKFVRYLTNIYEKVFQVDLSEEKSIVVNLLRNAMQRIEGTKNYLIHVSKDDYKYVNDNKAELAAAALTADVVIDVVEDLTMKSGDCMIETANGIFDCGIDTQLTAIKKKLMLLAYDGE